MEVSDLWDFGDPAASEARFRAAIEAERDSASGGAQLILRTQLARALGLQGRYAAALAELDAVAAAGSDLLEVAVRVALERGRVLRSSGDSESESGAAESEFRRAVELSAAACIDPAGDPDVAGVHVDALHMLALMADGPAEQMARTERALTVAAASPHPPAARWRASLLNNLGMAQHESGDDAAALGSFEEALRLRREADQVANEEGESEATRVARWMVAWTKRLLGRLEEALAEQDALAADNAADHRPDSFVHDELAALHTAMGHAEEATAHRAAAAHARGDEAPLA